MLLGRDPGYEARMRKRGQHARSSGWRSWALCAVALAVGVVFACGGAEAREELPAVKDACSRLAEQLRECGLLSAGPSTVPAAMC